MHLRKYLIFLTVLVLFSILEISNAEKKLVCFYNPMSSNRNGKGIFTIKGIDPHLCTHLIYGYFHIDKEGTIIQPQIGNVDELFIYNFASLRRINPNVKILASIGGPDFSDENFKEVAGIYNKTVAFSNKVIQFVEDFKFDGIDLYWPFPGNESRIIFVRLLNEVYNKLSAEEKILTISATPDQNSALCMYDMAGIEPYVEFINLDIARLNDINGFSYVAVPHSPIYPISSTDKLNLETIISNWIGKKVPNSKIIAGIPTYGRSYTLSSLNSINVGADVIGNGYRGEYGADDIRGTSILPFNEICYNLKHNDNWAGYLHEKSASPYAVYNGNQWIGYDDVESVIEKVTLAAIESDLGGVAFYDLDMDDFANDCGFGYFPLITAAFNLIRNDSDAVEPPTEDPITTTTTDAWTTTTTSSGGGEFSCRGRPDGNYQNPNNCRTFFMCANGYKFLMDCPGGLYYHPNPVDMCLHTVPSGCTVVPRSG